MGAGSPGYPPSPVPAVLLTRYGSPNLEGRVTDTRDMNILVRKWEAGDAIRMVIGCIMLPIQPLMALLTLFGFGNKPKEARSIATFRVERSDGTLCQARIEHDLMGATIDVGDYVSVWGIERGGVLVVEHAYNHTVGGEVILRR